MRRIYSLFALCALFLFITPHAYATDYTIETLPAPATPVLSKALPFVPQTSTGSSVAQQLYLASELTALGATAGNITGITFYYGGYNNNTAVPSLTRTIKVYITEIATDSLEMYEVTQGYSTVPRFKFKNPGASAVHEGNITTAAISAGEVKALSINFNKSTYAWDGSKNILLTVYDVTNTAYSSSEANLRFVLKTTEHARFVHYYWTAAGDHNASEYLGASLDGMVGESFTSGSAGTAQDKQVRGHRFIPKTTFSIVTPIPVPTSPSAGSISASSAVLSWTAAAGADSYEVRYGKTSGSLGAAVNVGNVTSYSLSELEDETIYYYQVRTKKGSEYSAWTDESSFTTAALAPHTHDNITFNKWSSTTSLPSEAGNYYLNANVTLSNHYSVPGNINLCLNGHSIYTDDNNIVVRDNKTLAIYDNVGGGRIYGYYVGTNSSYYGLVSIADGGTFVLNGGSVENLADVFNNAGEVSYGIYNNATLKLSGNPVITGYHGDIYLAYSRLITIESGKPLTNTTPYSIYKATIGPITDGWANMSGANPSAFFTSKEESFGVCYNNSTGEAELVRVFSTSDNNASIQSDLADGTYRGTLLNFRITSRSFTSEQYNTICLPFALSNAQLEDVFGEDYDLEEFDHSNLVGDALELVFVKRTALNEGEPYLIKPSVDVANPVFDGVTFYISEPGEDDLDEYVDFQGTFGPTSLEGGNKNLLFLGEDNELFWPASTGNLKGFRAYFEVKGDARKAVRARIVKGEEADQALEMTNDQSQMTHKVLRYGQLIIERNGKTYNAQGQLIK